MPWLDLGALWWCYQTCGRWRGWLTDHPEVAVYREARLHHHGRLARPLLAALKRVGPDQVAVYERCVDAFASQHKEDLKQETLVHQGLCEWIECAPPYPYRRFGCSLDACAGRLLRRGDANRYLTWVAAVGYKPCLEKPNGLREALAWDAWKGGLPQLAESFQPTNMDVDHFPLTLFAAKHSTAGLEYAAERWPVQLAQLLERNMTGHMSLLALRWSLSWAKQLRLSIDYESLYCAQMELLLYPHEGGIANCKAMETLEFLRPLARARFAERRRIAPNAWPFFPPDDHDHALICRALRLWEWPALRDPVHYAYGWIDEE